MHPLLVERVHADLLVPTDPVQEAVTSGGPTGLYIAAFIIACVTTGLCLVWRARK